jgi:hypothetical protein
MIPSKLWGRNFEGRCSLRSVGLRMSLLKLHHLLLDFHQSRRQDGDILMDVGVNASKRPFYLAGSGNQFIGSGEDLAIESHLVMRKYARRSEQESLEKSHAGVARERHAEIRVVGGRAQVSTPWSVVHDHAARNASKGYWSPILGGAVLIDFS